MNLHEIDAFLFFFINRDLKNIFFDLLMPFVTEKYYLFLLLIAVWLFIKNAKTAAVTILLAVLSFALSDFASNLLKHLIARVRPCNVLAGVNLLVGCTSSYSMPSNHAANAAALATPLYVLFKGRAVRYSLAIIVAAVGFSRVYVGVHYVSDVIAGYLAGVVIALLIIYSYKRLHKIHQT